MRTIIYGPPASGKTRRATELMHHFKCDEIVDGWEPPQGRRRALFKLEPGENALLLTNAGASACRAIYPDARILSIFDAKTALDQAAREAAIPEIAFPIGQPDGEGYVTCQRHANGDTQDWFLHAGTRIAYARPPWANGSILLHILGGLRAEDDFEEEGAALLLTPQAIRQIGADLIRIADEGTF